MGTEKRERQKAQRAARIEAERAAEARAARIRTIRNMVLAGVAIVAVIFLMSMLSSCASSSTDNVSTGATGPTGSTGSTGTAASPAGGDATGCPPKDGASTPKLDFTKAPPTCTNASKSYTAVITTTEGTVTVALDTTKTPKTVNNFVFLARWGYFDDTNLFRTEAGTGIIQGGSPHTNDNSDPGPGYTIKDEGVPFPSSAYSAGALAMANSGPNSAAGQFFLLANDGGRYLGDAAQVGPGAGSYAVFGKVTKGLDVLVKISKLDDGNQVPSKDVKIKTVKITES